MRIGIVSQSFPPARGGVAEHVVQTARQLQRRGHEVTVITSKFTPFDDDVDLDVRRIGHDLTIPANGAFVNLTVGWWLTRKLKDIEAERRFDVVHIHSPLEPVLPLLATRTFRAPKVGTFHTYVSSGRVWPYHAFREFLERAAVRLNARVAVSPAARDFIARYFPGDYEVIPNGVDVHRFRPDVQPAAAFRDQRDLRLLFVGRLDPRKGLKHLLLAFPRVRKELPNARLIVVGSGILQGYYERVLSGADRARSHFEGFVSAAELPRYYAAADVFCAPALGGESFGMVLLEAMATGTPIVASDIVGYNAVVTHEQEGLLVPPRDPQALAAAIVRLARDQALRKRLGEQGRAKAMTYAWESITDRLEEVYRRTVRGSWSDRV